MQKPVTLHAHFDGEHIQLDEPCELQPGTPLMVTVRPGFMADPEREGWIRLAGERFDAAYGDDEPEYPLSLIKEPNPEYEGG